MGFPPGGSNDIVARIIAPSLGTILGQQVLVENKPGASGTMGASQIAKSPADGYTLMLSSASPLVIAPHLLGKMPFNVNQDFAAVGTVGQTPEAIAVGPSLPVKNLRELLELSKKQEITISSSGNGGLLAAIPQVCTVIGLLWWGRRCDRAQERRWHTVLPMLFAAAGWLITAYASHPALQLLGVCLASTGAYTAMSIFWTTPDHALSFTARALGIAVINAAGNIGSALNPLVVGCAVMLIVAMARTAQRAA